ncbi:MAG TPA: class I SAM-dependent methyltransferase [Stellaceae bacterium]|nr:class I SAM-dependent methyltransferase [Stellaceae bacterium]
MDGLPWRARLRRLRFGLATLLGSKPYGYFIPYRYAGDTSDSAVSYDGIETLLTQHEAAFLALLARIDAYADILRGFDGPPPEPRWQQDWFPRLDGAVAYTLVRERRPRRIVEVGSGHSTRFLMRAIRDGGFDCAVTSIDPAPRADVASLPLTAIRATVQQADRQPFRSLAAGDMLFIDSSHILMPGSDVDLLFTDILPRLPAGVLVHIHDILLPDDYPPEWRWRGYNEQSAVALLLGGGYHPLFASHYVATRLRGEVAQTVVGRLPLPDGARETSLWLEKTVT